MFSQLRHAVENLTQLPPKTSQDSSAEDAATRIQGSTDSTKARPSPPPSHLAESALGNLRKTLVTQRPASPGVKASPANPESSARSRTTLEDRLRAKFVLGEASGGTTPSQSGKPSPSSTPVSTIDHPLSPNPPAAETRPASPDPLSPKSTPLPDSPIASPTIASPIPLSAVTAHPLSPALEEDSDTTDVASNQSPEVKVEEVNYSGIRKSAEDMVDIVEHQEEVLNTDAINDQETTATGLTTGQWDAALVLAPSSGIDTDTIAAGHEIQSPEANHGITDDSHAASAADNVAEYAEQESSETSSSILPATKEHAATESSHSLAASTVVGEPVEQGISKVTTTLNDSPPRTNGQVDHDADATLANGHADVHSTKNEGSNVEALQQRLKLVEQRFADVSTSFKRLQAEKSAADRILREVTPIESIQEADALRDFLQNMNLKTEMAQDEIKRLTGKLTRQEERIEELRDIHRLESKSQSDQIHKLRAQVDEAEALLKAGQNSSHQLEEESKRRQVEIDKLRAEVEKTAAAAKDEEEKRIKAISLLKTVRQKLVKAEKDRDDALKDLQKVKDQEKDEREKDRVERQKLQDEINTVNAEREVAVQGLRAQFDKDVAGLKERQERELTALRGQYELEIITMKSLHSKETENKSARISDLETSLQIVTREKDEIFDQLQMRQAELESSQSHLESLQSQTTELQYQLREATDRISLLNEEVAEAQKVQLAQVHNTTPTAEVTQLLLAAEVKYEARIADLRRQLAAAERERDELEADLSKKLVEKAKEVDHLKGIVGLSAKAREEEEETVTTLKREIDSLRDASAAYERLVAELRMQAGTVTEVEAHAQVQIANIKAAMAAVSQQLEESKAREAQARTHIKTLREELRKVQSSAALLERQRNPGVGYWASKTESSTDLRSPTCSTSDLPSTPRPDSPTSAKSEEEVNFEYLRNVILQFLEHKEMRPHLIRILSTILRFTPQETRRLIAKV